MSTRWTIDPRSATAPIILDPSAAAKYRFCFMGEFGYEMISWIPYLLYLKNKLGISLRTMGRTGSSIFYDFSDDHIELTDPPGDCWGETALYQSIAAAHPDKKLIHPGPEPANRRTIVIGGIDWRNRDIHAPLDGTHYCLPDYSNIRNGSTSGRPTVVINNKFFLQWPGLFKQPVNFIDRETLIELRDLLLSRGYDVVYNHFVEQTAYDKHGNLHDTDLFGQIPGTTDLRSAYAKCRTALERNRLQLATYNSADFVIGVQGGNLYLPAFCRRNLFLIMRVGNYIDYRELARICRIDAEMFYEPKHMLCWLSQHLAAASARREAA
jgi:hypothetical protein